MSKKTLEHPNTVYFSDARAMCSTRSVLCPCICIRAHHVTAFDESGKLSDNSSLSVLISINKSVGSEFALLQSVTHKLVDKNTHIRKNTLSLRLLMSYIYGAPILDVFRSHTTTQHSR
jgi:hypothetical protein